MGSVLVTLGQLIDALITTNLRLSLAMQDAYDPKATLEEIGKAKKKIIILNAKRNKLVNEIDKNFLNWLKGTDLYEFFPALQDYSKKNKETEKK